MTEQLKQNILSWVELDNQISELQYIKNKVKKSINQKYLIDIMYKYCRNKDEASKICDYIQENREIQVKEKIHFKKDKI